MNIAVVFLLIFVISLIMAIVSMGDIHFADQVRKNIQKRKIKGTIVFFKDKITHFK